MSIPDLETRVRNFLDGAPHAVVGASRNRRKYGNKVLRAYQQDQRLVYAINPGAEDVEGARCFASLSDLPERVHGVSIITPPEITEQVVEEAGRLGIQHLWMQPGAESRSAIERAQELGLSVIGGDACLLVVVGFREE